MFITNAYAQAAGSPDQGFIAFLPMIAIFVIFYFLLLRPQQKRAKEQKAMIEALAKGDEVVSAGGLLGKVTKLNDNYITLDIGNGVEVNVQRAAISTLLPKGTIKAI